jgi:hypothetical protein
MVRELTTKTFAGRLPRGIFLAPAIARKFRGLDLPSDIAQDY